MKLPARLLEFVNEQDSQSISTLDELIEACLLANDAQRNSKDPDPAVEIAMELSSSPADRELLWLFIQHTIQLATTKFQLSMIAAGPLEDLITGSGLDVIDRIENLAHKSKRSRYVLIGLWPQGNRETIAWQRIITARAAMMRHGIDSDAEVPTADLPI